MISGEPEVTEPPVPPRLGLPSLSGSATGPRRAWALAEAAPRDARLVLGRITATRTTRSY